MNKTPPPSRMVWLIALGIGLGASLRVWQYAANSSLWIDEIALAKGILDRDLVDLLVAPLPHDQVAPKGFLLIQKLAVTTLGTSDYVWRLLPFVCSLISLVAFARLAVLTLPGIGPPTATLLFATAAPFIAFGSVVKQYSTDVCVAVLLWGFACELVFRPLTLRRASCAAVLGAILLWLSQPAALVAVALGASLALIFRDSAVNDERRRGIAVATVWGIAAVAVVLVALVSMTPSTREYMRRYWSAGFPPESLARFLDTPWPWDRVTLLLGSGPGAQSGLAYPLSPLYPALTVVGYGLLWHENRRAAILLAAPVMLTLVAAAARQYPFSDRLVLFLVPSFMLAIAHAVAAAYRALIDRSRPLAGIAAASLTLPAIIPVAASPPPYRVEHIKPVLSHLQSEWQAGDVLYVYYGAAPATTFYASRYGLAREDYAIGGCHRGDNRMYLSELETFRGRPRVWVILTHALRQYREREDILGYLDAIGARRDAVVVESSAVATRPLPAELYLYDLSASPGRHVTAAHTFPVTGPSLVDRLSCEEGPQSMVPSDFECAGPPDGACVRR